MTNREIAGRTVFLTGASGGIGMALTRRLLECGATQIFAASRAPAPLRDERVTSITLDIADEKAVDAAAQKYGASTDILINNAGANCNGGIFKLSPAQARAEMDVNYFGLLHMLRGFGEIFATRGSGTIMNVLSMVSFVNIPRMGTYCASKAAAWSLTQAARAELSDKGVSVLAVFPSLTDTAMSSHLNAHKLSPAQVADATVRAILDGVEDQHEGMIEPDIYQGLRTDPKRIERMMGQRR